MKINNVSDKIKQNSGFLPKGASQSAEPVAIPVYRQKQGKQSFKGVGSYIAEKMVSANSAVVGAGVATTFVCTDFLGSEAPRIITGLFRNYDKTGQLNYKFASMEACRELLTAPVMMFLPIATFALADRFIGGSVKTPVRAIENFTQKMTNAYNAGAGSIKDGAELKKAFYAVSWHDALKDSCKNGYEPPKQIVEKLSNLMVNLESATAGKDKELVKNLTKEIKQIVSNEIKQNANVKKIFTKIAYKDILGKKSTASIGSFIDHMSRFAKDSIKSVGNISALSPEKFLDEIGTFSKKRIGSRVIMNFATLAASLLYVTQVPKIYKSLNKTNPGLIGLEEKKPDTVKEIITPVDYEAFKMAKTIKTPAFKGNKPSFKGLGVGRIAKYVQTDGKLRKFANAFEFDGINMSCAGLLGIMGLGVIRPRVKNAYDKHDRREILTRDIITISALIGGAKALQKTITRAFEKKSGIVMSEKAVDYQLMPKWRRVFEHLRPFGGTQVYSNDEIILKYTNVDKFKDGFTGFCRYIQRAGGNLSKFFVNDEITKTNMEKMLGKSLKDATDKEIFSAIKDAKNKKLVENIVNVFKNTENTFVKKSKAITGVFGFVSTFIAIPAFMIFLQKFNEHVTKKAIAKEQAEKKVMNQKFTAVKLTTDLLMPEKSKLNLK